jgi:hypothetical protein
MPGLSPYAARAEAHWREYRPQEYSQIPEAERPEFFSRLGEEIQDRVTSLAEELADQEEPEEPIGFKARSALLNTLRLEAEKEVLAQMLPIPAETEDPAGS